MFDPHDMQDRTSDIGQMQLSENHDDIHFPRHCDKPVCGMGPSPRLMYVSFVPHACEQRSEGLRIEMCQ
jgi:hypothetical protein